MRSSRSGRQIVKGSECKARIQADTTKAVRAVRHSTGQGKRLLDPSRELEVLKCIMLREGYLERLKRLAEAFEREIKQGHGQVQVLPPGMIDLLELLRSVTLDTVEAIAFWRLSQAIPTTAPFEWNGQNYLLKIVHDCDFLDRVEALRRWLGFSVTCNPFFLHGDGMNKTLAKSWNPSEHPDSHLRKNESGFGVGMEPWLGPLELTVQADENQGKLNYRSRKRRNLGGRSRLRPYTTPIINEPSLVPTGNLGSPVDEVIPLSSEGDHSIRSQTKATLDVGTVVPNLVSVEDMERMRVAEKLLIEEGARALTASAFDIDRRNPSVTSEIATSTRWNTNKSLPSPGNPREDLHGNDVSRSSSNKHNHSSREQPTFNGNNPQALPERSSHELQPLLTAAAGLVNQPSPDPHPGLGPVLFRSDSPNNDLHPRPFVHTVGDQRDRYFSHPDPILRLEAAEVPESTGEMSSQQAVPLKEMRGAAKLRRIRNFPRRSSSRQAGTTPTRLTNLSSLRKPRSSDYGDCSYLRSGEGVITPSGGRISPGRIISQTSSQKAGAELTALTAAGTAGRRQPPFRESRLRRLARNVSRHSNELRELLKTEQRLRRTLVYQGRRDLDGSALKAKQREIEWKTFYLEGKRDELRCLRMVQHQEQENTQALEMERRHRRLIEGQVLPEDETVSKTLEDNSALIVQKRFRGNKGRVFATLYKNIINQAAATIQRMVRFAWDRRNTRRTLLQYTSARSIQAAIRMFIARKLYFRLLRQRRELLACRKLQRVCRGMHGRRRAAARRTMIAAAENALEWVSLDSLRPKHLQDLAHVIHSALVDPLRQFPPAGVLGAIRVVLTILDDTGAETEMVTFETALGRVVRGPVSGPDLTWEMAARILGRPYRLLRRMRAFASGLGAPSDPTPTRILHLSPKAVELLDAYKGDPAWSDDVLKSTTEGSIASLALVRWAREIETVFREQHYVHDVLRDAQPGWLRKSRSFQRRRRALELIAESCRSALDVVREYRRHLESSGRAYGDPLMAFEVLNRRCKDADAAVDDLESKRVAFLASRTSAEAVARRSLKERVDFAEREVSVAAHAEAVAICRGQSGPEDLAELARNKQDCEVVLREMRRQLNVWERRSEEKNSPLLQEWVPPSEGQVRMARSLGVIRGWEEITAIQKARLVAEAGGRRFIKGATGDDMECWRRVCEGLEACREDIASGEERLAQDVCRYERLLSVANKKLAAEEALGVKWDNAGPETEELERQEDIDAARDERRTATGTIMPPGMFGTDIGQKPLRSSPRPTLLLLGRGLPAAARARIKDGLESNAPDLFGLHLAEEEPLPHFPGETRLRDVGILDPCGGALNNIHSGNRKLHGSTDGSIGERAGEQPTGTTRASLVQATLSVGKSVSLDVTAGPGLWVRGHFLRDLESLLGGLKDCGGCRERRGRVNRSDGPTVILVDGHDKNRSGGGADVGHGAKGSVTTVSFPAARKPSYGASVLPRTPVTSVGRRTKSLLEEAAQCLQDLSLVHGATAISFQALSVEPSPPKLSTEVPIEDYPRKGPTISTSLAAGDHSLDVLMAACFMMLHPNDRYDVGEDYEIGVRLGSRPRNQPQGSLRQERTHLSICNREYTSPISSLAQDCRRKLAQYISARGLAEVLREVDPVSIPVDTAVALRHLTRHHAWPDPSPRPIFSVCPASAAFTAWIVATTSATVELVLRQGGDLRRTSSWLDQSQTNDQHSIDSTRRSRLSGQTLGTHGMVARQGSMADRSGVGDSLPLKRLAQEESMFLQELEESLIDDIITVVDEDFPGVLEEDAERQRGKYCRTSEIFATIMKIVLRSFRVYEEADTSISLEESINSLGSSQTITPHGTMTAKFSTAVSRAFGSIYVFAEPSFSASKTIPRVVMARASDQELMLLLSANWMEKHDLSALRDLSNEKAMWRAFMDTLVFKYLPDKGASTSATTEQNVVDYDRSALISTPERERSCVASYDPVGGVLTAAYKFRGGSLHFRHARRLTLETCCSLLGHKVPVAVFEESRGDFWCEARVTNGLVSDGQVDITVGRRIPKECIRWLLEENHTMHAQTVLDAADLRELSALIADRLKLYRVNSAKVRREFGRDWLTMALSSTGVSERVGAMGGPGQWSQSKEEFRLSLRKRGVGQVVFSRLVSFREEVVGHPEGSEQSCAENASISSGKKSHVQRLVIMKEEGCGKLRVEVHDPDSGGRGETIILTPELTTQLLKDRNEEQVSHGQEESSVSRYWQNSLLWRLKLVASGFNSPRSDNVGSKRGNRDQLVTNPGSLSSSSSCPASDVSSISVDSRTPLLYLNGISVRCNEPATSELGDSQGSLSEVNAMFNLVVLGQLETDTEDDCEERDKRANIELVTTHLRTMSSYNFQIPASVFAREVSDEVMACLVAPSVVSTEPVESKPLPLHDLAGKWLSLSQRGGCPSIVTLNFPGMEPVKTSPFITLRASNISGGENSKFRPPRKKRFPDACTKDGDASLLRKPSSSTRQCLDQVTEDIKKNSARDPDCLRQELSQGIPILNSSEVTTATLRNERMVFRRKLPVSTLDVPEMMVDKEEPPVSSAPALDEENRRGTTCDVLDVSVYEVFSTGLDGRVERHLRFCARDENLRPSVEAVALVPWAGTCEGFEGGELWQVITEGLTIQRVRDDKGRCIRMDLNVAIQGESTPIFWETHMDELDGSSRVNEEKQVCLDTAREIHDGKRNDHSNGINDKSAPDKSGVSPSVQWYQGDVHAPDIARVRAEPESPLFIHHSGDERSVLGPDRLDTRRYSTTEDNVGGEAIVSTTRSSVDKAETRLSSSEPSIMSSDGQGDAQAFEETGLDIVEGEDNYSRTRLLGTKIYDEWLCITGVRLHVLCFQEETKMTSFKTNSTNIDEPCSADCKSSQYPADRSGESIPHSSYLRFIACDPVNGQRTRIDVSVEELRINSSVVGGLVDEDLLLVGRRPVLAKALACKLSLSFEVGGGYTLILPFPKEWKRVS